VTLHVEGSCEHFAEEELTVSDVALWASRSMSWSAADIVPGRYYFVVVVDPENAIGVHRMQRMEFVISSPRSRWSRAIAETLHQPGPMPPVGHPAAGQVGRASIEHDRAEGPMPKAKMILMGIVEDKG
jgi:hypothetical protein